MSKRRSFTKRAADADPSGSRDRRDADHLPQTRDCLVKKDVC